MRRVAVVISVLLFVGAQLAFAQAAQPVADYVKVDPDRPVSPLNVEPEQTHYVGNLDFPMVPLPAEDTFATYAYTYGDIVIFSYSDSNECEVIDNGGTTVWSATLMEDEYFLVENLGNGVFEVVASKEFSVLSGDPFATGLGCWYAVDQNSRPISTKLLSVGPGRKTNVIDQTCIVIFSYHDATHAILRNMENDNILWEGDLDSADYYLWNIDDPSAIVYSVEASKPVSTMTGGGVVGMYAPAFNGTFTGRDFMTYEHYWNLRQDVNIVPWEDSTTVTITNLDNSSDTIWQVFCRNAGEIKGTLINNTGSGPRALYIHSDKVISVSQTPWVSYVGSCAFYLVRGIDRDGLGLGQEFYLPIETTKEDMNGIYYGRVHVIAYSDNTDVKVGRIPRDGGNETTIWEGTLDRGEFYRYTNTLDDDAGHAIYHVTASEAVSTIGSSADDRGSDFLPLWFAIHPDIAANPDQFQETECKVPVSQTPAGYYEVDVENNGNIWDVVNIFTTNSEAPDFETELFDELGGILPDVDNDGNPDSDTLAKGASVLVLADVTPVNNVPFGTTDTCFFEIVSVRDAEKRDTALLVTRIRAVAIGFPDTVRTTGYPGEYATLDVYATSTSHYRDDTVNLSWTATKPEATWEVRVFDAVTGFELDDNDGDGSPDVPDVAVNEEQEPFGVQVFIPDTAIAGDEDTILLVGHSANYPFADYPTVEAISVLIVTVEPAPAILIRPDTTDSVPSGHAIYYPLEVLNYGNGPDVPEITFTVTQSGWSHRVLDKDLNDLPDTDTDGTPDAGTIPGLIAGEPGLDTIYLEVRPPYSALSGVMDSTVVLATSSVADTVWDIATVRTITRAIVSLDIDPDTTMIIGVGDTAVYDLRVTNNGGAVDTVAVGSYALPDLGWSYAFTFADSSALTDSNGDGDLDMGAVDSATTEILRLLVIPHEDLGKIMGEFDTTVTEIRYVWIRTVFTDDMELVNDSVQIVTVFEPELDIHNYPNPFSGQEGTTFAFTIPRAGIVTLRIYNRAGEHIVTLLEDEHYGLGGVFRQYWNGLTTSGNRPAPGVYLYTLEWKADDASGLIKTKRITKKALLQP